MREYPHSIMPLTFFEEGGKYGVKDIEGDIIFAPVFDELNTSTEDLNYTSFSIGDQSGIIILSILPAATVTTSVDAKKLCDIPPQFYFRRHKGVLLVVFSRDGNLQKWNEDDLSWMKDHNQKNCETAYSMPIAASMKKFAQRTSEIILPPGNLTGGKLFFEVFLYLLNMIAALNKDDKEMTEELYKQTENIVKASFALPYIFFGEGKLTDCLIEQMRTDPENIKQGFATYIEQQQK